MHRIDAELVAGVTPGPIAEDVAAGAVDHAVDIMWGWLPVDADYRATNIVELRSADTGHVWPVEVGTWTCEARQGKPMTSSSRATRAVTGIPSATVTAPTVDLALWAWTRGGDVRTDGDPAALRALDSVVSQGML